MCYCRRFGNRSYVGRIMDTVDAVMMIEGNDAATGQELVEAWQLLIDTGVVWTLQGRYGRMAQHLIEVGICKPKEIAA